MIKLQSVRDKNAKVVVRSFYIKSFEWVLGHFTSYVLRICQNQIVTMNSIHHRHIANKQ